MPQLPTSTSHTTSHAGQQLVDTLLLNCQLKAAAFIVTLYGDVVEPRGGVLWMGNIIESCAAVGISENLVRTAVSRLMAAGQLQGERSGRRSFYRLTNAARAEFSYAAKVLYDYQATQQWRLVYVEGDESESIMRTLKRLGYAAVSPRLAMGPDDVPLPKQVLVWQAEVLQGRDNMRTFVAEHWDLPVYAEAYQGFISHFQPVEAMLSQLEPATALTLRLLMVHEFRHVALRAPHLPVEALPEQWEGHAARQLFARLYVALSKMADAKVVADFVSIDGELPANSQQISQRLERLAAFV